MHGWGIVDGWEQRIGDQWMEGEPWWETMNGWGTKGLGNHGKMGPMHRWGTRMGDIPHSRPWSNKPRLHRRAFVNHSSTFSRQV